MKIIINSAGDTIDFTKELYNSLKESFDNGVVYKREKYRYPERLDGGFEVDDTIVVSFKVKNKYLIFEGFKISIGYTIYLLEVLKDYENQLT
jgi:hypothetical protein